MREKRRGGRRWKPLVCLALVALTALTPGCWGARELKELALVLGIGIDKNENDPGMVYLTAQIAKPSQMKKDPSGGGSGGEGKAYWNLKSHGWTVFDAIREATQQTSNKLYVAHNEAIVFGMAAAEDGVEKYLDFFLRGQETRPTTDIIISTTTAADVLDVMPELDKIPGVNLSRLTNSQGFTSHAMRVTLQQFTTMLMSPTTAAVAPVVSIDEENGKKALVVHGMAVFKKDKMVGTLNSAETRGLLWAKNKVQSGVMDVAYQDGIASIEIINATCKADAELVGDRVVGRIKVRAEGSMVAQTGSVNLASVYYIAVLEGLQAAAIKLENTNAISKASQLNADLFGFGDLLHKKYKDQWQEISANWDRIFPAVAVELDVECKIRAAGNITRPIGAQ